MDYYYYDLFITLAWIVALIVCALMLIRYQTNKLNMRERIVTAMIEKNADVDIEEFIKKLSPRKKLLKEKLLTKLLVGSILSFIGVGLFGWALFLDYIGGSNPKALSLSYFLSFILLAIGIGFLVNYFVGKKMLAKEIEAEERKLISEA